MTQDVIKAHTYMCHLQINNFNTSPTRAILYKLSSVKLKNLHTKEQNSDASRDSRQQGFESRITVSLKPTETCLPWH